MAESSGSQLTVDWFGFGTDIYNMSDWTNIQDPNNTERSPILYSDHSWSDHQKRSNIVHAIIHNRSLDHLQSIVDSGWDVNETLRMPDHYSIYGKEVERVQRFTQRTAFDEAGRREWTEGMRILFDAGAKCKPPSAPSDILIPALQNPDCRTDLIDMLLRYGADPNDHNYRFENIPLLVAIDKEQNVKILELLLEHGADPNVISAASLRKHCPLSLAIHKEYEFFIHCFRTLVDFGPDVNYDVNGNLHNLLFKMLSRPGYHQFHKEQLDLFFLHGGNIDLENRYHITALEYAVRSQVPSNSIRWLIRHGVDISPTKVALLAEDFNPTYARTNFSCFSETALILLQAGMHVSNGMQREFRNMEISISAWLQDNTEEKGDDFDRRINAMWAQLVEVEEREVHRKQGNIRKPTFPEYWTHQMNDLQEFSDESLHFYPEENLTPEDQWQYFLHQIHRVLEFLSQPQSLRWYCRRCVRENLVSLQPSVVKTLPGPARLKRYILCHEI